MPSDDPESRDELRSRIIGFGERSHQKSYYPELQKRLTELERFRTLLDHSSDAIFLITLPSGLMVDVNETACRQLGFLRSALLDKTLTEMVLPPAAAEIDLFFHLPLAAGAKGQTITTEMRRADGSLFPVEMTARHVSFDDNLYAIFVIRDIRERKRAEQELRHHAARAEALVRIAGRLNAQLEFDSLLKMVCEESAAAVAVPAAWILLYEPTTNNFEYAASVGLPEDFGEAFKPLSRALLPDNLSQGQHRDFLPDVQQLRHIPNAGLYRQYNVRTLAWIVMLRDQQLVGMLVVGTFDEVRMFQEDELILLNSIGDQAAQAILNVRLFTNVQRHLRYEHALHEIDLMITANTDLPACIDMILNTVRVQLGVDAAAVLLLDPIHQTLKSFAGSGFNSPYFHLDEEVTAGSYASQAVAHRGLVSVQPVQSTGSFGRAPELFHAEGFSSYFAAPLIAKGTVQGVLELFNRSALAPDPEWLDFYYTLATQTAIAINNLTMVNNLEQKNRALEEAYDATLQGLSRALSLRDEDTEEHTRRVHDITLRLARQIGIDEAQMVHVSRGALLHDIGKIFVPDEILHKNGPLSPEDWVVMRKHPQNAYDMLWPIAYLRPAIDIPYCHHERWDGTGYPKGLKGEQIPLVARLFAVIDVWDAMRTDRPYRKAMSRSQALDYLHQQSGKHFDPYCVEHFLALEPDLQADYETNNPASASRQE